MHKIRLTDDMHTLCATQVHQGACWGGAQKRPDKMRSTHAWARQRSQLWQSTDLKQGTVSTYALGKVHRTRVLLRKEANKNSPHCREFNRNADINLRRSWCPVTDTITQHRDAPI